jgi:hypothetical protein
MIVFLPVEHKMHPGAYEEAAGKPKPSPRLVTFKGPPCQNPAIQSRRRGNLRTSAAPVPPGI